MYFKLNLSETYYDVSIFFNIFSQPMTDKFEIMNVYEINYKELLCFWKLFLNDENTTTLTIYVSLAPV